MTRPLILLSLGALVLSSCAVTESEASAVAREPAPAVEGPVATGMTPEQLEQLALKDVRGSAESLETMLERVRSRTPKERKTAADALDGLTVTCPYNRSVVQLVLAMDAVSSGHDAETVDELVRKDWEQLRRGLSLHVELLDALDADLPLPSHGDFLVGRLDEATVMTRAQLEASADPLGDTVKLMVQIKDVVEQYDDDTHTQLEFYRGQMRWTVGTGWPLWGQLVTWHETLQKMEPHLTDPALNKDVRAMLDALEEYRANSC